MKSILPLILILSSASAFAQWSDTNSQFYDSLHMPVCTATGDQQNSIVIKSYPDGGYFVIWEDFRTAGNQTDLYAQKYDQDGNALWAANGVPVAIGPGWEQIAPSSNADYRNYSHGVTDSAGGLFLAYQENAQLGSYYRTGIAVQHISANGSVMFPDAGLMIRQPTVSGSDDFGMPQLVADGKKGFYISFTTLASGYAYRVTTEGYRLNGNTLIAYVSQIMNDGVYQTSVIGPCGLKKLSISDYPVPTVYDYFMWPDTQGGCNVVMNMSGSDGGENIAAQKILAFNALKRVKKECTTTIFQRTSDVAEEETITHHYQKDSVIRLYSLQTFFWGVICLPYEYTNYQIENFGLGYNILASGYHDGNFAKGATATAPGGNINVNAVALSEREYKDGSLTQFVTKIYTWPDEIYDSLPYQRASSSQHYQAYNTRQPDIMNSVEHLNDTVLHTSEFHDFNIVAAANKIYLAARLPQTSQEAEIYLQQLEVKRIDANSFSVNYNTPSNEGVMVGKEIKTPFGASNIGYGDPMLSTDGTGNVLFYIPTYHGAIRVSPIINGTQLSWGAMGRALGSGIYNNSYYTMNGPFATTSPGGTGMICWNDDRYLKDNSRENIFMRHLDNLDVQSSFPPLKTIKLLSYGSTQAWPSVLLGSSKSWSIIEAYTAGNQDVSTPVLEILDDYNLGNMDVFVYQNTTPVVRSNSGKYYLDRNYTIKPQNNPGGAATIKLRLFFTTKEFESLKAVDHDITDPSSLVIIKQPSDVSNNAPSAYTPAASDEVIVPTAWQAVAGGYYVEIPVKSFSNFFIESAKGTLPVTWLGIQAQWLNSNEAKVSWQVADQRNVKDYSVQQSLNGTNFTDVCNVSSNNSGSYNCAVPASPDTKYYFRVKQTDIDGRSTLSKIVTLSSSSSHKTIIYPNPAKDHLFIRNDLDYSTVVITDLSGKIVLKKVISKGLNNIFIEQIPAGTYFIKLSGSIKSESVKFVKE